MNNLIAFPYCEDIDTLLRWSDYLTDVKLSSIFSFKEDYLWLSDYCKRNNISLINSEEFYQSQDDILLLEKKNYSFDKYIEIIQNLDSSDRYIYLAESFFDILDIKASEKYVFLSNEYGITIPEARTLYDFDIPIIAVAGMGENCNKFEVLLMLKSIFNKLDINAAIVSSNELGYLFGTYTLPRFLFREDICFSNKVTYTNRMLFSIFKDTRPDVIVIDLPGGIMPMSEYENNHFSEIPLTISNAAKFDYGILCTYYVPQIPSHALNPLQEACRYKYGIPLDAVCISRQKLSVDVESKRVNVHFLNDSYFDKHPVELCESDIPIIPLHDKNKSFDELFNVVGAMTNNFYSV